MSKTTDFITSVYRGKTIVRIQFNWRLGELCQQLSGDVLNLGAGSASAIMRKSAPASTNLVFTDLVERGGVDRVDVNQPLPYADNSFDYVTLFFVLYILEDREVTLRDIRRVLKPTGTLILSSPFISGEMPEPHDYCRLTSEGLEKELGAAGFTNITVERIGGRVTSAVSLLHPLLMFNTVRLIVFSLALLSDYLIQRKDIHHPVPNCYLCIAGV